LLRGTEALRQLVDAGIPCADVLEDAEAHRLAEHAGATRDLIDDGVGQRGRLGQGERSSLSRLRSCSEI
jgi:hypothetical protein